MCPALTVSLHLPGGQGLLPVPSHSSAQVSGEQGVRGGGAHRTERQAAEASTRVCTECERVTLFRACSGHDAAAATPIGDSADY